VKACAKRRFVFGAQSEYLARVRSPKSESWQAAAIGAGDGTFAPGTSRKKRWPPSW
jgi:hypothetical protein